MLWLKRLTPFILLLVIVYGYFLYSRLTAERQYQQAAKRALVTAQVWIASARFRSEPERFLAYRDSLLPTHGLSVRQIREYLDRYRNRPESYDLFTKLVNHYVDSLCAIEASLLQPDTTITGHSIEVAN